MNKNRLEAFSDGVLAVIITIMVLEIKAPQEADWESLKRLIPVFISYLISFLFIGIYWGNHHHLLHTLKNVNSPIMLANLNLLFWLSLVPVATNWMGETHFAPNAIIVYAVLFMFCGFSYSILQRNILKTISAEDVLGQAIKKQDKKVLFSTFCAMAAILFAFINPIISGVLFILQSAVWLIPDKNIENALKE